MSEKLRKARKAGKENHLEQEKNTPKNSFSARTYIRAGQKNSKQALYFGGVINFKAQSQE